MSPAWWAADLVHPHLGRVQVSLWHQLHFRQAAAHALNLIQVQRLDLVPTYFVLAPLGKGLLPFNDEAIIRLRSSYRDSGNR
jgi:hypothetical protein